MIHRRELLIALAALALAAPRPAMAQQPRSSYRIGYISSGTGPGEFSETFRQGMRDLGYVEGQNLLIEYRWTGRGRLPDLVAQLVELKPDVIVSVTHAV